MKRILALALLLTGCNTTEPVAPVSEKATLPEIATTWTFSPQAKLIAQQSCHQCHHSAPFPAGYSTDYGCTTISGPSIQLLFDALAYEMAPAHKALSPNDKKTMMSWAMSQGATWHKPPIPATLSWSMDGQIGSAPDGSSAAAPGKFFGFRVEDLARLDSNTFLINTHTDRNGLALKGIEMKETVITNPDSFPSSQNPNSYIFVSALPFQGRMRDIEFSGYVMQDGWAYIGFHTREMKKGPSPLQPRLFREYVRLTLHSSFVAMTGKKVPAVGDFDAEQLLTATSDGLRDVVSLASNEWYRVVGHVKDLGAEVEYYAEVWDIGGTGQGLIATVGGTRPDNSEAYGGIFFGSYSRNSPLGKDRFAGWEIDATLLPEAGAGGGGSQTVAP